VIVLLAPYLSWSDVAAMPNLRSLCGTSLLADTNVRSGSGLGSLLPGRGALVLSAGAPVDYAPDALSAYNATESIGSSGVAGLFRRASGFDSGAAPRILYLGRSAQAAANRTSTTDITVGALGAAAHAAGSQTAAIGNGDLGMDAGPSASSRPAAEAAADQSGTVDTGDVSRSMLRVDLSAPYGVRADTDAIVGEYLRAMADADVGLIVVDPGDLSRAQSVASGITTEAADVMHAQALLDTDEVLRGLVEDAGPDDAIVVVAAAVVGVDGRPAGYGPAIVSEGSGPGLGVSSSTRRDGIVTVMDVSATIIDLLGGTPTDSMVGSRIRRAGTLSGAPTLERVAYVERLDAASIAVESVKDRSLAWLITLTVAVLLGTAVVRFWTWGRLRAALSVIARIALLAPLAVLLGGLLQFALWNRPASAAEVLTSLAVASAIVLGLATASSVLARKTEIPAVPLIVLTGATAAVILVDQWLGAPLSSASLFGYSTLIGARFYGLGNEMAGLLFGCAIVAWALVFDARPSGRWTRSVRGAGWLGMGVVLVGTAAAPFWGANVGPAVWMTVGLLVGWSMLRGRRLLTWANLALWVGAAAVAIAALVAIDLSGAQGTSTHLGRVIAGAGSGDIPMLWTIIQRRWATGIRSLGWNDWIRVPVTVLALLACMRLHPAGEFAALLGRYRAFSVAIAAALAAGLVSCFSEDSGVIVAANMLVPVGIAALYLMLLPTVPGRDDAV
jgi:hypothetical protein